MDAGLQKTREKTVEVLKETFLKIMFVMKKQKETEFVYLPFGVNLVEVGGL